MSSRYVDFGMSSRYDYFRIVGFGNNAADRTKNGVRKLFFLLMRCSTIQALRQ